MKIQPQISAREKGCRLSRVSASLLLSSSLALVACSGQQAIESKEEKGANDNKQSELSTGKSESNPIAGSSPNQQSIDTASGIRGVEMQSEASQDEVSVRETYRTAKQASERMMSMKVHSRPESFALMGLPSRPSQDIYLPELQNRDKFERQVANGIMVAGEIPVSTFSIDVDTGSYSTLRRSINHGVLPERALFVWRS